MDDMIVEASAVWYQKKDMFDFDTKGLPFRYIFVWKSRQKVPEKVDRKNEVVIYRRR